MHRKSSNPRKALIEMDEHELWRRILDEMGIDRFAGELEMSEQIVYAYASPPHLRKRESCYSPLERAVKEGARVSAACWRAGYPHLAREVADYLRFAALRRAQQQGKPAESSVVLTSREQLIAVCARAMAALVSGDTDSEAFHAQEVALAGMRHLEKLTGYKLAQPTYLRAVS